MLLTLLSFQGATPEPEAGRRGGGVAWPNLPYERRRVLPEATKRRKRARVKPARPPTPTKRKRPAIPPVEIEPEVLPILPPIAPAPAIAAVPPVVLPIAAARALDQAALLARKPIARPSAALSVDQLLEKWREGLIDSVAESAGVIDPAPVFEPAPLPPHLRWPDDEEVCIAAAMLLL